jgi:hypothetical protein
MESGNDDECNEILSSEDLIDPDLENEEEEARQEYEQKGNKPRLILVNPANHDTGANSPSDDALDWPDF